MKIITWGSSGTGSVNKAEMDRSAVRIDSAAVHLSLRISMQMAPVYY